MVGFGMEAAQPGSAARREAERYVETHCDPAADRLPGADGGPPLSALSEVWLGRAGGQVTGVAFAFPLWPERPALGVHAESAAHADALLAELVATRQVPHAYVICAEG